ncbi:MAG: PRC-barrel domain-containing protein [Halococcoides sp.]
MPDILAENLSGKTVMGSDGVELGTLYNITMNLESGELHDLLIDPAPETDDLGLSRDGEGHFQVPVGRVQSVSDHMIIER